MKSFAVTLLLLVLLLLGVVANHLYINKVANEMFQQLDALPSMEDPDCLAKVGALVDYWQSQSATVEVSVNFLLVDRVNEQTALLLACASAGDLYGFASARALLRDAVEDILRFEKLTAGTCLLPPTPQKAEK